jgi:peroxiredoxin
MLMLLWCISDVILSESPTARFSEHKETQRMLLLNRSRIVLLAMCLAIAGTACQQQPVEQKEKRAERKPFGAESDVTAAEHPASQPAAKTGQKTALKPKPVEVPPLPPPSTIPQVVLSDALRAVCVVGVSDKMPEVELPDPAGNLHTLSSMYGQKLTVVCVWTIGDSPRSRLMATRTLKDLVKSIAEPFGEKGVRLIGIDVGDPPAAVQQRMAEAEATFPTLLDPKGEFCGKLATDRKMPRAYLLDSSGRILWFDVELPRDSLHDLVQGIRVSLAER